MCMWLKRLIKQCKDLRFPLNYHCHSLNYILFCMYLQNQNGDRVKNPSTTSYACAYDHIYAISRSANVTFNTHSKYMENMYKQVFVNNSIQSKQFIDCTFKRISIMYVLRRKHFTGLFGERIMFTLITFSSFFLPIYRSDFVDI